MPAPHPDQPDGIDPHSAELPDPQAAAERIRQFLAHFGDGLVDLAGDQPLYARDLEVLASISRHDNATEGEKR